MTNEWTPEEEEAFNEVEKHSNLGKQILRSQGQPYHWEAEAIKAAVRMEREACAKVCEEHTIPSELAAAIRARGTT